VCQSYFQLRSEITPYLEPYYNTYAAPYVESARPYVDKLDKQVYKPVVRLGKRSYGTFGAPRIDQARAYGQSQWRKTVRPKLELTREQAQKQYDSSLAPHVSRVSAATKPYYNVARHNILETYHSLLLPTYASTLPYAQKAYTLAHGFVVDTGLPYTQWAWASTTAFVNRTLWPQMRILYGENVEPQLVRISERLGRYRDGKKVKAVAEAADR